MSRHEYEGINKQDEEEEYDYDDSDLDDMLEDEYLTGAPSDVSTPQDIVTARSRARRRKRCLALGVFFLVGAAFVAVASHFRHPTSDVKLNPDNSKGAEDSSIGKYGASSEENVPDTQGSPGTPPSDGADNQQGSYEDEDNEMYAEDIVNEEDMYDDFEHESNSYDGIENGADDYEGFEVEGDDYDEFLEDEEGEYEFFESEEQDFEGVEPNEYEDPYDDDDEFDLEQVNGFDVEGSGLEPEGEEYYDDLIGETEASEYYDDFVDETEGSEPYDDELEGGEYYDDEISGGVDETDYMFDEAYDEDVIRTIPALLENALASVYRQDSDTDTPMYWITTTTVAEDIFGECLRLTQASALEEPSMDQDLRVTEVEGSGYVNVDLFTLEGIDHAKEMRLAERGLADVVVVPFFYPGSSLFDPGHRAQCFTIFRDPVEEVVRSFVDSLDDMDMEDADLMTIEDYANSDDAIDNYMTRSLSNNWDQELRDEDLALAKSIIERKCLVGLADELTTSIARFEAYFGWTQRSDDSLECQDALLEEEREMEAEYPYVETGSQTWHILAEKNSFDIQLYSHARLIFEEQNKFFVDEGGDDDNDY